MARTRNLQVVISGDAKDLERAFKRAGDAADKNHRRITGFASVSSKGLGRVGAAASGMAAVAGGAVTLFAKNTADAASDINESLTKNEQLFGRHAAEIDKWSKTTSESIGIGRREALGAAGDFGSLFETIGLADRPAANMSRRFVKLAADLASFNNSTPTEALEALRSGLIGEAEPMRKFGALLSENRVKQEAYRSGIAETGAELTEQQKVQARYRLILRDTAKAQGDFARTSNGAANQQRILKARMADMQAEVGRRLLPAMLSATKGLNSFLKGMQTGRGAGGAFVSTLRFMGRNFREFGSNVLDDIDMIKGWGVAVTGAGSRLPFLGGKMRELNARIENSRTAFRRWRQELRINREVDRINENIESLKNKMGGTLSGILRSTRRNMGDIKKTMTLESAAGQRALGRNFDAAVGAIRAAMRRGEISTRTGLRTIRGLMLEELRELGIRDALRVGRPLQRDPPRPQRAAGGWMGQRGQVGVDTIPAMLAPGEAVLNRHQQAVIEGMLGHGFLDQLFATVRRPHYMQKGGRVRLQRGGRLQLPESFSPTHQTAGLAGYPAVDVFASPGTPVGSPVSGTVARLSGQAGGPGGGGAFGYSLYLNGANGRSYFLTHFGSLQVRAGQKVSRGQTLGTVADYPGGVPDHIHEGIHGGLTGIVPGGPSGVAAAAWGNIGAPRVGGTGLVARVVQGTLNRAARAVNRRGQQLAEQAAPPAGVAAHTDGPVGGGTARWAGTARQALQLAGMPATRANVNAILTLMGKESSGNPTAVNPTPVGREHATGIMQMLPSTFRAYALSGHGNILSPLDNIIASIRYQRARYGGLTTRSPYARGGRAGGAPGERKWLSQQWDKIAPLFGLSGKTSPLSGLFKHIRLGAGDFVGVSSDPGAKGHETDELLWPSWLWRGNKDQKALDPKTKLKLFIHEMAHRFQAPGQTKSAWETEGGAEAFARIVMGRMFGGSPRDPSDPYNAYTSRVMRDRGWKWATKTQFGMARGGRVGFQTGGATGFRRFLQPAVVRSRDFELRSAQLASQLARAQGTRSRADDIAVLKRQRANVAGRLRVIARALGKNLTRDTRLRLLQEQTSLRGDYQQIGDAIREAKAPPALDDVGGVGGDIGGDVGGAVELPAAPTESDFIGAMGAQASLTRDLGDDLQAARALQSLRHREYQYALGTGDPRIINETAAALKSANDAFQDLEKQVRSQTDTVLDAELAQAELTETTEDDRAALEKINARREEEYQAALASQDPADIAEAARALKQSRDALKALQADQQKALEEHTAALKQLADETKRQTDFATSVAATSSYQLTKTLADLLSGQIVGYGVAGRRFTPGAGVEYAF